MRRLLIYVLWMSGVLFMPAQLLWAHPPGKIELNYNVATQMLEIKMDHVSSNLNKHYIRLLQIVKNQDEPINMTLPTQTSPEGLLKSVSVAANPGDTISVKVYSTQGGIGEESLVVPEPSDGQSDSQNTFK